MQRVKNADFGSVGDQPDSRARRASKDVSEREKCAVAATTATSAWADDHIRCDIIQPLFKRHPCRWRCAFCQVARVCGYPQSRPTQESSVVYFALQIT